MEIFKNANLRRRTLLALIIISGLSGAFGLGRLSVLLAEKEPIAIDGYLPPASTTTSSDFNFDPPVATSSQNDSVGAPASPAPRPSPKTSITSSTSPETALFIGSKTGKNYYFPWCGIVKRIKAENQITFNSRAEAEKAGYKPGNCAGMK